jgi:deoxyribose-phosphate aldolase
VPGSREWKFATVCINPTWVALAARQLRGTRSASAPSVGFPLGATTPDVKQFETRRAIFDGASEIDMVINVGALKSGDVRLVTEDIRGVVSACHAAGAGSKVIIETALLTDEEKITACTLSKAAGADFVKTVDGLRPGRRHGRRRALMRRVVGDEMGVKASGGVRDLEQMKAMVAAERRASAPAPAFASSRNREGRRTATGKAAGY